jgi:signal transduction histidine kinase
VEWLPVPITQLNIQDNHNNSKLQLIPSMKPHLSRIPQILLIIIPCILIIVLMLNAPSHVAGLLQNASGALLLTDSQEKYPLGLHMDILEDPGGDLTIEDVSSPAFNAHFIPSQDESPNYGFTKSVYWVRLDLKNETIGTDEWWLEVDFPNTQYVDLYTPLPGGGGFDVSQSGILRPVSTRGVLHPEIVFSLSAPTQGQQTIYVRFQTDASMTLALTLWTNPAFLVDAQRQLLLHGLFFGILFGLLVYNLFLLFSLRDANYLYFVFGLAAMIFFAATYDGYTAIYFPTNPPEATRYYIQISFSLLLLSIVLFADSFLEIKTKFPKLHTANLVILTVWGALMVITPFTSYHFLSGLSTRWALISLIVVLAAGINSLRRGFRPAWLFLIAWAGLLISLFIAILVRQGSIPITPFNENLFRWGMVWLAICWSIALADRINLLKDETEGANHDLRKSERRLSQILEGMPLGVVLYGKDQTPKFINQRTVEILSNPASGIQPDLVAERTMAQAIQYYSFKRADNGQEYPLEKFPPFSAIQGVTASVDDLEMDQGDRRVPLEIWASPIMDDSGNVESAVVAFQDITRRKQADADLAEYRRHLEALVTERTIELDAANKELRLRLEWMSAIVLVTETMTRSSDFSQIYDKIIEIINRLFETQDSFIAELNENGDGLRIIAHSSGTASPDLIGSLPIPAADLLPGSIPESESLFLLSGDELEAVSGPLGQHIQSSKVQTIVFVPLRLREQVFGFLGMEMLEEARNITGEESNLLGIFSLDIAHLIEDSRLFEQARELITTGERTRLASELHDSVTQTLFTASVLAEATPRMLDKDQAIARQYMEQLSVLIRGALAEMRSMLIELRSGELANQSLDQLLMTLMEAAKARSHTEIALSVMNIPDLPKDVKMAFYRIAREALNNALVHASATQIQVSLIAKPDWVELHVQDTGCGFNPQEIPAGHLGISIMAERAANVGGDLQVHSVPGEGTDVIIRWPGKSGEPTEYGQH